MRENIWHLSVTLAYSLPMFPFVKRISNMLFLRKIHIQNTESSDARIFKEASRSAESRKNPSQAKPWQVVAKSRQVWAFLDCILHWQTFQTASYNFPSSKYRRIQNKKKTRYKIQKELIGWGFLQHSASMLCLDLLLGPTGWSADDLK